MVADDVSLSPLWFEVRQAIARLSMMSQVSAAVLGRGERSSDEDIGGRRPSGGIDRKADRQLEFRQKSADHFARRLAGCRSERALQSLLADAVAALDAWQHTPLVAGVRPSMADPRWKQWVGVCEHSPVELARWYGVSRQYISRVRSMYRLDSAA